MFFIITPRRDQLSHLAELADQGHLRAVVARTFALSRGRTAYETASQHHGPGKTVLVVRDQAHR